VKGLAAAFGVMTAILVLGGLAANIALLAVAPIFGVMTYLFWAHGTGRLMSRVYRGVEDRARTDAGARGRGRAAGGRGGFGAGPREEWTGPRGGRTVSEQAHRARQRQQARARGDARERAPRTSEGPTVEEASAVLGVDPDADEATVRRAYRERIKQVHPDADGDEESFKRVQRAYDRLTE
jgi:hypothetical protein